MRMLAILIVCLLTASPAAAKADFEKTEPVTWSQYDWKAKPFRVPTGWQVTQEALTLFSPAYIFKATPEALPPGVIWMDTGFMAFVYPHGLPDGIGSRDHLHLAALNALTHSGKDRRILATGAAGNGRHTLMKVKSPGGVESTEVIVTHEGENGLFHLVAFARTEEFESSGAQAYLASTVQLLTGDAESAKAVRDLAQTPQPPKSAAPYAAPAQTKRVIWSGRSIDMPADWQVSYQPTGKDVETAFNIRVTASPNPDDPAAPIFGYSRYPGGEGKLAALPFMKRLMARATETLDNYTILERGSAGSWACTLEAYERDGHKRKEYFCLLGGSVDGHEVVEGFWLSALPEDFERMGGARSVLMMTGELPEDRLSDDLTLALDPVKKLLTTRRVAPFPPLVPVGSRRAPVGWNTELSYLNGEFRFIEPGNGDVRPTLISRNRFDTGTDAEIALTDLIERYEIEEFELEHSAYIPQANGVVVTGTGMRAGSPIKIGALAETGYPTLYVFFASPDDFDAYGGASLLGPVYLGTRPDAFKDETDPEARIDAIVTQFGAALAERRERDFEMQMWTMKTNAETMIHANRAFMYSMSCGGWC